MAVMSLRSNMNTSKTLLRELVRQYPDLLYVESKDFYWSPKDQTVHFNLEKLNTVEGGWSLIHELAHGLLRHSTYKTDYELLSYEVAAWQKAVEIAGLHNVHIETDHIEECLDSYRNWLYARSTCPTCKLNSLQVSPDAYKCMNCLCKWTVSPSRFCRPYRLKTKTPSEVIPQMVFAEKIS